MPLLKLLELPGKTNIGVWKAEEPDDFFMKNLIINDYDTNVLKQRSHPLKRKEWLVSRFLIKLLLNVKSQLILKSDKYGRPVLHNHDAKVSLSHSNGYAAVITSMDFKVGIDVEKAHPKVLRVAERFTRQDETRFIELFDVVQFYTLIWSVKETVYKMFSEERLSFKEHIKVKSVNVKDEKGTCIVEISNEGFLRNMKVHFEFLQQGYVLTYAYV